MSKNDLADLTEFLRHNEQQIGFTTARYFATVFNENYHCTPQQFREQVG